jgi:hypothetical protein
MIDEAGDDDTPEARRRAFLQRCGRFAIVTPPVVTLMLTVSEKAEAVTSAKPTATTTTTPTTTPTTTTPTKVTTTKTISSKTMSTSTVTASPIPTTTGGTTGGMNLYQTDDPTGRLAMIIDSMGLMKS